MKAWARLQTSAVAVMLVSAIALPAQGIDRPLRVYATTSAQFSDFESMAADLAKTDVVFVGERHNDAATHRLELALLEALARRRGDVILALEMFDRDAQDPLDHFLMGHLEEAEFAAEARAWPTYATDYKPLVDFAIAKAWPVVAASVPRAIAAEVSKEGLAALTARPDRDRRLFASELPCPMGGDYYTRFIEALAGGHGATGTPAPDAASRDRDYLSQCLKDETMAESVAQAYVGGAAGGRRPLVVMIAGAFHVEFGDGIVASARRRLPDRRIVTATILPVDAPIASAPDQSEQKRADYLVYVLK